MIFSFFSSSFACLEPKLDRLKGWSIFVGIWAICSVAQSKAAVSRPIDVCDYFWLNLSKVLSLNDHICDLVSITIAITFSPSPLIDSIAVSVFADIFIELTNTEMAATTLWALEWMWEIIQKWSWDWTEDLAKNRAGFVKNSTGFLAIIQLVFATANLDWTRFLRHTLQKYVTANTKIPKKTQTQCLYSVLTWKLGWKYIK